MKKTYQHLSKKSYWVCWDLGNGDGTIKDFYLWVYESWLSAFGRYLKHLFSWGNTTSLGFPQRVKIQYFKPHHEGGNNSVLYNLHYFHNTEIEGLEIKPHSRYED